MLKWETPQDVKSSYLLVGFSKVQADPKIIHLCLDTTCAAPLKLVIHSCHAESHCTFSMETTSWNTHVVKKTSIFSLWTHFKWTILQREFDENFVLRLTQLFLLCQYEDCTEGYKVLNIRGKKWHKDMNCKAISLSCAFLFIYIHDTR